MPVVAIRGQRKAPLPDRKFCKRCGEERPIAEFPLCNGNPRALCRVHWREFIGEKRAANRDKWREYYRAAYARNPERFRAISRDEGQRLRILVLKHYGGERPGCACCGDA